MSKTPTGSHPKLARRFNGDPARVDWHNHTLWVVREKRDKAANTVPDWEELREAASAIKTNVLNNLHDYLIQFENNVRRNGVQIHWAESPEEHNRIVHAIIQARGVKSIVKSKSMLTEECHLNDHLAQHGIEVVDTDLGERIIQFAGETPSHIVAPCVHWKKEEISDLFHEHLNTPKGNTDPQFLAAAARLHLRARYFVSPVAITGVNFAVAETGEIVACTNEGNADLGVQLADVHIACMGIEKIIPLRKHLGVFLRLLARSSTGQPITTYSSHFRRPAKGKEMHIVLLDNGRSTRLANDDFRNALKCIRCGACFNTCPVYRRSGGHSYHAVVAGPIGSILAPGKDMASNADLPFASTLCGSCSNVCPVKIDIHQQLYAWRQVITQSGFGGISKRIGMQTMNWVLASPARYRMAGRLMRWVMRFLPFLVKHRLNPWYRQRDLPSSPRQTFKSWYRQNRKE